MKIAYYEAFILPFIKMAESDGDAVCTVFFSREEDSFKGAFTGMDEDDALMVVKELAAYFRLKPTAVVDALDDIEEG